MMRRLLAASLVLTVALVALSPLCAGAAPASGVDKQNGEGKRSPAQVVADAGGALSKSSSFKLAGSFPSQGKTIKLDLVATRGQGGGGTIGENGGGLEFVVSGPSFYLRGDATFWMNNPKVDQAEADLLAGKWFRTTATNNRLAKIAQFADVKFWSKNLYTGGGKLTKGSQHIFHGSPVIAVHDEDGKTSGTLLIAATGKPFPVAYLPDNGGPTSGLVVSSFNSATPPAAPAGAFALPNS